MDLKPAVYTEYVVLRGGVKVLPLASIFQDGASTVVVEIHRGHADDLAVFHVDEDRTTGR